MIDENIDFLNKCTTKELDPIVQLLIYDDKGSERLTEELSVNELYKKHQPDHSKYSEEIINEILQFGTHSMKNFIGIHDSYRKIVLRMVDRLEIQEKCDEGDDIIKLEGLIVDAIKLKIEEAKSEQDSKPELKSVVKSMNTPNKKELTLGFMIGAAIAGTGGAAAPAFAAGTGGAMLGSINVFGPAYRILLPIVLIISNLRRKYKG